MLNTQIKNILSFICLLLVQVLMLDNICLGSYVHPVVYIIFIMQRPFKTPRIQLLLEGFAMGIAVDVFNGTPGLNAAATVLVAYLRPYVIDMMTRKSELDEKQEPTVEKKGAAWFFVYSLIILIIHNFTFFLLEAFTFKLIGVILLEMLASVPVSALLILLISYLFKPIKKKKIV
ncbi:MAG: rod shape-determining protein MreD [Bacteroidales bacterium]|nr:rod shape-determining protein MreD [Bacteroidales bacterium]